MRWIDPSHNNVKMRPNKRRTVEACMASHPLPSFWGRRLRVAEVREKVRAQMPECSATKQPSSPRVTCAACWMDYGLQTTKNRACFCAACVTAKSPPQSVVLLAELPDRLSVLSPG